MKTNRIKYSLANLLLSLGLSACYVEPPFVPEFPVGQVEGYKPLYRQDETPIRFTDPRPLVHPGKIYVVSNYLLINERYEGIHVFDNTDPASPIALGFLEMSGNTDVAVKDHVLYGDHLSDLVAVDIQDMNNLKELSRFEGYWDSSAPPGGERYFECIDPAKGVVIGWELATLHNPKCFR